MQDYKSCEYSVRDSEIPNSTDKEAFWLSSTVFVWLTDMWHFAQMIMKLSFVIAIVFYKPLFSWYFDAAVYSVAFSIVFELFYSKILIRKK